MRERHRTTIEDLRLAIESLPRTTRIAMLEGLERNDIIVGAYSDSNGICPMLAAYRAGGRTSFISFAKAWDRFGFRGSRDRAPRRRRGDGAAALPHLRRERDRGRQHRRPRAGASH